MLSNLPLLAAVAGFGTALFALIIGLCVSVSDPIRPARRSIRRRRA